MFESIALIASLQQTLKMEESMHPLDRITQKPEIVGGRACIRGLRVTVGMIVGQVAAGLSVEDLLTDYPYLQREDIFQALRYAARRAEEREVRLLPLQSNSGSPA